MLKATRLTLIGAGLAVAIVAVGMGGAANACSATEELTTGCQSPTTSVRDDHVDLSVDVTVGDQGSGSHGSIDRTGGAGSSESGTPSKPAPPPSPPCPGYALVKGLVFCDIGYSTPLGGAPAVDPADPVVGRAITLADIASFRAGAGIQGMEPDGWIVTGLEANFYASATQHTRSGTLLGSPAEVRFTPVAYRWEYGDGTGRVTSSPGASWATLGVPEFSSTTTSHVYTSAGGYLIRLTVHFSAEYRWAGSGWTRISGTVAVPANDLEARAGDIRTVLVARNCAQNPSGPGC